MRYRTLAVLPLAWGAVFLLGDAWVAHTPGHAVFLRTQLELAKAMALAGSLAAALAFERREYLRRAWLLIGGCMALLLLRDATLLPLGLEAMGQQRLSVLRGLLVVVANLSQIAGTWMLARAWKRAALALPVSRGAQWLLVAVVVAAAVAVTGPAVLQNVRHVEGGDLTAVAGVASAAGDAISLFLIAPLLLTALALRGGLFGWPFSLLTASYMSWLLYDALLVLGPGLALEAAGVRSASELFRALGCLFGFSAGLAQRFVVEQLRITPSRPSPTPTEVPTARG
jgi:hypothetical protein